MIKIKKGCMNILRIEHDDWCKTLTSGSGDDCNCQPVTRLVVLETDEDFKRYFEDEEVTP